MATLREKKRISGLLARDVLPQCGGLTTSNKKKRQTWHVTSDSKPQKALRLPLCSLLWITPSGGRQLPGQKSPPADSGEEMGPTANSHVSEPSWKQPLQATGQVFRLLQPQGYVNVLFLLKVLHINFSIQQWILVCSNYCTVCI